MKRFYTYLVICTGYLFIIPQGCMQSIPKTSGAPQTMAELSVSSDFKWESSRLVDLSIGINLLTENIGTLSRISVYDADPSKSGKLIIRGAAGYNSPFESSLRIPAALKKIYLQAEDGTGSVKIDSVAVSSAINYSFNQPLLKSMKLVAVTADCTPATSANILTGNLTYSIKNGGNYYVTGDFSGTINFSGSGGTITVCGNMHPASITNMGSACTFVVGSGGTINYAPILAMGSGATIYANADSHIFFGGITMSSSRIQSFSTDFVINSTFTPSGSYENYGAMTIGGDLNLGIVSTMFVNAGPLSIGGDFNLSTTYWNNGGMDILGHFNLNGGIIYNNCKVVVHQNTVLSSGTMELNGAYFREIQLLQINSGATVTIKNNSMISTFDYVQNTTIQGTGGRSDIKITNSGSISSQNLVNGSIELVTTTGTLTTGSKTNFTNGATLTTIAGAKNVLAVSNCNLEGIGGTAPPNDSDADGVPDALDNYPNDPTRAFDNFYPSKNVFGSFAFEDLWPYEGDYDMNDLVVDYRFNLITNAQNYVVDINPQLYVRAAGAGYSNGFGLQLDGLLPGQVKSVTGCSSRNTIISVASNGVENNQNKAVIIPFDDFNQVIHFPAGSAGFYNTTPSNPKGYGDTLKVNIHLTTPLSLSIVGSPPYNPFLIQNMKRGVEIHLADHLPSSLADISMFGTGHDNSNQAAGRYYKTTANLPWALDIPVKFDYPAEKIPIIQTYLHFPAWAQSSGSQFTDWYTNTSGYRTTSNIYQ